MAARACLTSSPNQPSSVTRSQPSKGFEADFSQLQASIDAVSAQMSKETGQAIDTELKPALQAADAAMGNYNAFAACQLKFYSQAPISAPTPTLAATEL